MVKIDQTWVLDKVNGPEDVKKLTVPEMKKMAGEMRKLILNRDSKVGGHVGPNLGVVELTIAFHYVFDSPKDKIIWDVSHQSYGHKILTGRKQGFEDGHFSEISGFTSPAESPHDFFTIGHTSTSIGLATSLATARDLQGEKGNVVALIGDGSLSGGLAFEGLNNAGLLKSNLIIIVNDNQMSIDEDHGSLYPHLAELRRTNGKSANNIFKALGFDYRYLGEGNELEKVIALFQDIKDIDHPIVLHICTEKGLGYPLAMEHKMEFHWKPPFDLKTGKNLRKLPAETYNKIMMDYLEKRIREDDPKVVAIDAAIPGTFGLTRIKKDYPERYFDAGIAEQFTITFATALASAGVRPVVFHASTFLQRAYDQLVHDLAINKSPAVLIVGSGDISDSDETHQGTFDIPMITSIPNIKYLAPTTKEELLSMLDWALAQKEMPVAIRLPEHRVQHGEVLTNDYSQPLYQFLQRGTKVAVLGLGGFLPLAEEVISDLKEKGIQGTLINPGTISELDEGALEELKKDHQVVITLEDGSLDGGFGEQVDHFYSDAQMNVLNYGALKEFNEDVTRETLYDRYHLKAAEIADEAMQRL